MVARDVPEPDELLREGRQYEQGGALDRALECYRAVEEAATTPERTAEAACRRAAIHRKRCEWDEAFTAARRSEEIARESELWDHFAEALNGEAAVHLSRGDFAAAVPLLERMMEVTEDTRIHGIALQNLGLIAAREGDRDLAERRFLESSRCFQRAEYARGEAFALNNYAAIALDHEDYEAARAIGNRAVTTAREVGDLELVAVAMKNFGEALAGVGEFDRAEELASGALGYFDVTENEWRRVECLLLLGDISRARDERTLARRFYRRGLALAEAIGAGYEVDRLRERLETLDVAADRERPQEP